MPESPSCPICQEVSLQTSEDLNFWTVQCRRCGTFKITFEAKIELEGNRYPLLPFLSAYTRQTSEAGTTPLIRTDNWEERARRHKGSTVQTKARKLLRYLGATCQTASDEAWLFLDYDYPLIDAVKKDELVYFARHLEEVGYIKNFRSFSQNDIGPQCLGAYITVKGWEALDPISSASVTPGRCFIPTWFDDCMDDACEAGIKAAVKACGYDPTDVREVHFHCCPVKSRIESIGWGHRGIRFGSRMAGVPVKRAFFRIA